MKTMRAALLLFLSVTTSLSAATPTMTTTRYLVATRHHSADLRLLRDVDDSSAHDVRQFENIDAFAVDLTEDEAAELRRSGEVRYITPTVERHLLDTTVARPSVRADGSKYLRAQTVPYGIDQIHAREVWKASRGAGVNVACLDTGIDYRHLDLSANYAGGYNVFTNTDDPFDDNHHGTHVAGIVGARDNDIGVVGVAPEARLWAVKVLKENGGGTDESIVAGVDWVISKKKELGGQWIITLSLGSPKGSPAEDAIFQKAADEGILTLAASGNNSLDTMLFPAGYSTVLAVGATDESGAVAKFSNGGPNLGVVAPGVKVLSTFPIGSINNGRIDVSATTSYAAAPILGTPLIDVTAPWAYCGLGRFSDFPADIAGKIAVIERGDLYFADKVRNAKALGAAGVVIYNNVNTEITTWSLFVPVCDAPGDCHLDPDDLKFDWPLAVAMSQPDSEKLLAQGPSTITIGVWTDDYDYLSGTSMSTPHVAGIAALLWSLDPGATAHQVMEAITSTAHDIGPQGLDIRSGFGFVDALAAAKKIAPQKFGLPETPVTPRRPGAGH